jgi:hypothetical protein
MAQQTLAEHSGGNLRILCGTAAEQLEITAEKQLDRLDEKLFIKTYSIRTKTVRQKKKTTIQ